MKNSGKRRLIKAIKSGKKCSNSNKKTLSKTIDYAGQKLEVSISATFLLMAAYFGIKGLFFTFVCSFVALVLHEFSHAREARKRGYVLDGFRLMPYGASLYGRFEGVKWQDEVRIAVAGPLFNLFLAVFFVAIWWLIPSSYSFTLDFVFANLSLAAFNVLPVYPLDGGRVALAYLTSVYGRKKAYKIMRVVSYAVVGICLSAFIVSAFFGFNPTVIAVGAFLLSSALIPDKRSHYCSAYDLAYRSERVARGAEIIEVAVTEDSLLKDLFASLSFERVTRFVVYDRAFCRHAELDEFELKNALARLPQNSTVSDALTLLKNIK